MPRSWRLVVEGPRPGAWNMGVDEALLESAAAGGTPTLRLYAWAGPWLSVGYAQPLSAERRDACRRAGLRWVRRATGGRAVLHGADLTYAVAAPERLLPDGLRASYELIGEALQRALQRLGVAARRAARDGSGQADFDCFAAPAGDELVVGGRKLVGSAQRRAGGGVLQHGSLRLAPDPPAAMRAAGVSGARATSLAELGVQVAPAALRAALVRSFAAALGARFQAGPLSGAEVRSASERIENPPYRIPPFTPGASQGVTVAADT